jgi:SAM-dependent methyltransferase
MEFGPGTFGAIYADRYDGVHDPGTTEQEVDLIQRLGGGGRVLELAIGTGRVALPLVARGVTVEGVEASPEMVAVLRGKAGGAAIPVTLGDMADVPVTGPFTHAYLVFNTFFNLTTQAAQLRLFANLAPQLAPGGTFLLSAFVPSFHGFTDNQRLTVKDMDLGSLLIEAVHHDPVAQRLTFQRVRFAGGQIRLDPLVLRYAWTSEIDLMARLAGLTLRDRWGDWRGGAFSAASRMHVSVYERASG